jgi:NitT/TauT family transport system substrate-binding protein
MRISIHDNDLRRSHGLNRRNFLRFTTRLAASAAITGSSGLLCPRVWAGQNDGKDPVLKIGYIPILDAAPLLIGHAKGFFADEGVEVEKPVLIRGWSALSESFLAGHFNLVHLLLPLAIFMRYAQNHSIKVVAWNHMNGSGVTVGASSGIRKLEDLSGKQIAIPFWYSIHNVILQLCLRNSGLEAVMQERNGSLKSDRTNLFVMNPPDMPVALASGAIDGYIVAEPFNASGEVNAKGKLIRFTGDVFRNHPCCVAAMHADDIAKRPTWTQKVVNGLVRAQQWTEQNRDEAAHILSRDGGGYLPMPGPLVSRAMTKYDLDTYGTSGGTGAIQHPEWAAKRICFQPYPFESATREVVRLLKETKVEGGANFLKNLDAEKVVSELFDYDFVKKAASRIGGLQTFEGIDPVHPYIRTEMISV